ncbi:MAG: chloride channel protein, partial [Phycisphaerales bacterium]
MRARGHGVTQVLYAVHRSQSRIEPLVGVRQWLASTFTIASGGSAGPEGPIVTIGATIGSNAARLLGARRSRAAWRWTRGGGGAVGRGRGGAHRDLRRGRGGAARLLRAPVRARGRRVGDLIRHGAVGARPRRLALRRRR